MSLEIILFVVGFIGLLASIAAIAIFRVYPHVTHVIAVRQANKPAPTPAPTVIKCPKCHATLKPDPNDSSIWYCDYCGYYTGEQPDQPFQESPQQEPQQGYSSELIVRPLFVIIALVIIIVILPVVASISTVGTSASSGLISMSSTIANFMPIFGLGLAIGLILMFIALATILRRHI